AREEPLDVGKQDRAAERDALVVAQVASQQQVLADRDEIGARRGHLDERVLTAQVWDRDRGAGVQPEPGLRREGAQRALRVGALLPVDREPERRGARRYRDLAIVLVGSDRAQRVDVVTAQSEVSVQAERDLAGGPPGRAQSRERAQECDTDPLR